MQRRIREGTMKLPKYVTEANGRIVYRPRIPAEHRGIIPTDKHGRLRPPIRLGKPGDPEHVILEAYLAAHRALERQIHAQRNTIGWMIEQYLESRQFRDLSPGSQRGTRSILGILDHPVKIDGQPATLRDLGIHTITKPVARRLSDRRLEMYQQQGKKGTATVNRQITLLATAWRWAEQHLDGIPPDNPWRIRKFRETPNKRYVTDDEYRLQHQIAAQVSDYLPVLFELTYLTATRGVEAINIKLSDIDPDRETGGIHIHRRKGSRDNIIELQTAMQRLRKTMQQKGLSEVYWNLHLLKSKAVSDAQDDRIAGHKSEAMRQRYNTKTTRHKPAR